MAEFLDGPARGITMDLRRCPTYLRLVHDPARTKRRGWDALDLPDDHPEPGESLALYRIEPGTHGVVFVRPGGRFEYGKYRHVTVHAETLEQLADREHFLAFAVLHHAGGVGHGHISAPAAADLARLDADTFRRLAPKVGGREVSHDVWALDRYGAPQ